MAHQSRKYLLCRTEADATYRLGSLYMRVLQIRLQVAYDFELLIKSLDKVSYGNVFQFIIFQMLRCL